MINGHRVRIARELSGLTQSELATRVGIDQSGISYIESRQCQPSVDIVEKIIFATGFPMAFLEDGDIVDFPQGSLIYRARAAVPSRDRAIAYRHAQVLFEILERLAGRVNTISVRIPRNIAEPKQAAALTRAAVGLSPDTPIPNIVNAVEKSGVVVLLLPVPLEDIDAFSTWAGLQSRRPVIVIPEGKFGHRLRFSIAHELGHLVMHEAPRGPLGQIEREANQFAAEFLLPEIAMRQEISTPVNLFSLSRLKEAWGVSLQFLVRRAAELEIITERQYRYLFQQLSARGWKRAEPDDAIVAVEKPRLLRRMAEVSYGVPIDFEKFATDMRLTPDFLKKVIEFYAEQPGVDSPGRRQSEWGKVIPLFSGRRKRRLDS